MGQMGYTGVEGEGVWAGMVGGAAIGQPAPIACGTPRQGVGDPKAFERLGGYEGLLGGLDGLPIVHGWGVGQDGRGGMHRDRG